MLQLGMHKVVASGIRIVTWIIFFGFFFCTWISIPAYALQCLLLYCMQFRLVDAL